MNPSWYLQRFKAMSVSELQYRIGQTIKKNIDKYFKKHSNEKYHFTHTVNVKRTNIWEFKKHFPEGKPQAIELVKNILSHRYDIFGIVKDFGKPINWHLNPKTGNQWPLKFWGDINYRNGKGIGGIKFAWELNRFHHFPKLAIAYTLTKDKRYKEEIFNQLQSWLEANPYPKGINWISGIELGIRIVNIVYTLKFLSDDPLTADQQRLTSHFILVHGSHLYRYPSKYSSCANHAIAEALGLFTAGICFPHIDESNKWKKFGQEVLEREVTRQIYPDGSNYEHSTSYLQFVLDHFLIYYLLCKEYGEPCGQQVRNRLKASFEFISHIIDKNGNYPTIGDDDDGYLLKLWFGKHNNFISLLNKGAVLFDKPEWILENAEFDQKTLFLLGASSKLKWDELKERQKPLSSNILYFKKAGIAVIRDKRNPDILFVGNSGPLGLKPLAGHGHADALSFWLSVNGKPIFVDPGTYLYHSGGKWRDYFRSTSAHNTIRIDHIDQATIISDFMFDNFYNIHNPSLEENGNKVSWSAGHDGYMRLKDPVFHKREVIYVKNERRLIINDYIECSKTHLIESFFHLHPKCSVSKEDCCFEIKCDDIDIKLEVDKKWNQRFKS